MPFTLAHPAVIVPFARHWPAWLPLSALVMGSLAPDLIFLCSLPYTPPDKGDAMVAFLGYFPIDQQYGHGWPGLLLVSLPTALALLAIFHAVLKWPLVSLFPPATRAHLIPVAQAFTWTRNLGAFDPAARLLRIVLAILVGIATHILLDGFTHKYGWAVDYFPGLLYPLAGNGPSALTVADGEQIACSLLGLLLLFMWARNWRRTKNAEASIPASNPASTLAPWTNDRTRIALLTLGALGVIFVAAMKGLWTMHHMGGPLRFHGGISIAGLWIVRLPAGFLFLYSIVWWFLVGNRELRKLPSQQPSVPAEVSAETT